MEGKKNKWKTKINLYFGHPLFFFGIIINDSVKMYRIPVLLCPVRTINKLVILQREISCVTSIRAQ